MTDPGEIILAAQREAGLRDLCSPRDIGLALNAAGWRIVRTDDDEPLVVAEEWTP